MTDDQLIDYIAHIWIDNGGDAEGMAWCWAKIMRRIEEIEKERISEKTKS
jgi:hypothetical protein